MLELPNFGHMTTSKINSFFENIFILRRPGVANSANIIKIATMFN